ncbi:MAG: DUF86 domain-containing protein [Candidatus Thorarchaeota archaeon]|nr:DUF86 domain-containing protein [Candidatus Thorarchaeota archaeon]NIW14918.1 DUF86 domain-containing protein [Candidatus Thorarchaeota archaeon]NIW52952.1 DUF86 domain-containing protein [Candidatus Korarchaeota archaeon]
MLVEKEYLKDRMQEVEESIQELQRVCSAPFEHLSIDKKYAIRYQIITIAESIGSIALHLCLEEYNKEVDSFAEALSYLQKKGLISHVEDLIDLVRLRNLVVHRYWTIDDEHIYRSVKNDFIQIKNFLRRVREEY